MATIKSHTDIPQSKKLAEFLPHESADMYYPNRIDIKYQGALPIEYKHGNPLLSQEIAAWSLAALLGVLPKGTNISTPKPINELGYCCWNQYDEIYADNPIDACVAMIEHLHELKML